MLRAIRFVLDTQLFCLKMEPKKDEEDWNILAYSDSDWLQIQRTASASQVSSFTLWEDLSVGYQRTRKELVCPEVKPNM
jgi:hypothetical protein